MEIPQPNQRHPVVDKFVTQMNQLLPQDLDTRSTMVQVEAVGSMVTFNCKLHCPLEEQDFGNFIREMKPEIVQGLANSPITPILREHNLILRYAYCDDQFRNKISITLFPGEY